jgi:hypothetical protein
MDRGNKFRVQLVYETFDLATRQSPPSLGRGFNRLDLMARWIPVIHPLFLINDPTTG